MTSYPLSGRVVTCQRCQMYCQVVLSPANVVRYEGATSLLLPSPPSPPSPLSPPSPPSPPTPLSRSPRGAVVGGGRPGEDFPALNSVPFTDFSCVGRRPGYYADQSTACQVRGLTSPQLVR
ncbi:hypothetical protein FHG87_017850 [Trinorchestia longiramus]|nr:hypothetical protein FHG87_017850 [Trinorchestia longiramus]